MGQADYSERRPCRERIFLILRIAGMELENLLLKKAVWILNAAYVMLLFVICRSDDLRQGYFSITESVPVTLINFVAPVFLAMILICASAPAFAGDREQNVDQIPAACLAGRRGRSIAKLLAAVFFSVLVCMLIGGMSAAVSGSCHLFDSSLQIRYVGAKELVPVWTAWQHFIFSLLCLTIAGVILTLFILFVSCNVKTMINAVSIPGFFVVFEFLVHRFSFPAVIREYNIWVFFEPCCFFLMEILNFSPLMNLLILWILFMPLCVLAVWRIIRRG